MSDYIRLCTDLADKGTLIEVKNGDLSEVYSKLPLDKDSYISAYYFNDKHHEQFKEKGSVAGITDVFGTKIFWDCDSAKNLNQALSDVREIISRLLNLGLKENTISVFFSGQKGFEVAVRLKNKKLTPTQTKNICMSVAEGLETVDPVVYNATRIIRLPLTKHQKTGLYKIPLSVEDVNNTTVEEILEMAKNTYRYEDIKDVWEEAELPEALNKIKDKTKEVKQEVKIEDFSKLDLTKKPKFLSNWKYALSRGIFPPGMRSNALLILAATYKHESFPKGAAYQLLKAAAEEQAKRYNVEKFSKKEIWVNIIEQVYGPNWNGGSYTEDNFPENLKAFLIDSNIPREGSTGKTIEVATMSSTGDSFLEYIHSFERNDLKFGLPSLDKEFPITAGTSVGIVGAASSGKTAAALKLLSNASKSGMISVFASLDMSRSRMFEKMLYRVTGGMKREEIFARWKDENQRKELLDLINEEFGNVYMFNKSSPTVEQIREYIDDVEKKTGKKVELLMIDYFERIMSDFSDDTKASKMVANGIQDIVNDYPNIRAITLVQPSKFSLGGGPDTPILSYTSIKGSSFLYQAFRQIISLWRPFFNPETKDLDHYMQMAILKNDLGELGTFDYGWKGKEGEIFELQDAEKRELRSLLKQKKEANSDDSF